MLNSENCLSYGRTNSTIPVYNLLWVLLNLEQKLNIFYEAGVVGIDSSVTLIFEIIFLLLRLGADKNILDYLALWLQFRYKLHT